MVLDWQATDMTYHTPFTHVRVLNPLNVELNPICHLLALAGAHNLVDVSRIRVNERYDYMLHLLLLYITSLSED
jgi:hypothetical protein